MALTDEQRDIICNKFAEGVTKASLSRMFDVSPRTIHRLILDRQVKAPEKPKEPASGANVKQFASRAKSILWRQDSAPEKPTYNAWKSHVEWLKTEGGLTDGQAVIRASKEYPVLHRLFNEYDLSEFDVHPGSHAALEPSRPYTASQAAPPELQEVNCEGVEQSYRDNCRWAADAAGTYLRSGKRPTKCPNDTAWFLYRAAIDEPKDFMSKLTQIEGKSDKQEEARQNTRRESRRSADEIYSYLDELTTAEESDDYEEE